MPNYKWSSESRFLFFKLKGIFKEHGWTCESWISINPQKKKTYYIQATLTEDEIAIVDKAIK